MPSTAPQIKLLPESATVRLRSTLAITALSDAISELVQNSLDASAKNVTVQVNLARNSCVVEDDGVGILPEDVGMVGSMYATSKYQPSQRPTTFGFRGQALASLSTHSLFTLTSRHSSHLSTHTTRISYSTPLSTGPAPPHLRLPHPGTVVRIEALHADLPVRFNARLQGDLEREWEAIVWRTVQLLLTPAARGVSCIVRDEHGVRRISVKDGNLGPWEISVLRTVYGRETIGSNWERVRAVQGNVKIKGWVSAKGYGARELQFLYVNGHPLPVGTALHTEINRVFAASSFGVVDENEGRKKAVERYGMFVLWIQCEGADALGGEGGTEGKAGLEGGNLAAAVTLLQKLLREFLRTHHFRPATVGGRDMKASSKELQKGISKSKSRSSTPLSTIKNGGAVENYGDARALSLWSRVKSAKMDIKEEEGRKGTGFAPVVSNTTLAPRIAAKQDNKLITPDSFKENGIPASPREDSIPDSSRETDDQVLWGDPISKRSFHVNARTGNTKAIGPVRKRPLMTPSHIKGTSISKKPRTDDPKMPFVETLLKNWTNPIFAPTEAPIPTLITGAQRSTAQCGHDTTDAFIEATSKTLGKLTKTGLQNAKVVAQVDRKYVLVKMCGTSTSSEGGEPELLVIIDQHAADERVRVEKLFKELPASGKTLVAPLVYAVNARDAGLLKKYKAVFAEWGIEYHVQDPSSLYVTTLPAAIAERCIGEPTLVIDMLRRHIYELSESGAKAPPATATAAADITTSSQADKGWVRKMAVCPKGLVEIVNSRACRTAIMFNDVLEHSECVKLVERLAQCSFPFMCAHGRPSMVPLVDLGLGTGSSGDRDGAAGTVSFVAAVSDTVAGNAGGGTGAAKKTRDSEGTFKRDFKSWVKRMEEEEEEGE